MSIQLNIDGQQVTQTLGIGGQPLYSRDAIAEFQFISNRFDATQGRSSGVQVNAVSKSGTNTLSGLFSGSVPRFRLERGRSRAATRCCPSRTSSVQRARWAARSCVDRLHFFANFEYDRTPKTSIWNTPFPAFNITLDGKEIEEDRRRPPRLSALAEHAADGEGVRREPSHPVRHRQRDAAPREHELRGPRHREYIGQFTHVMSNRASTRSRSALPSGTSCRGT